ncbi:MAG: ribonuclease J [Deltaproteobacteria bacterium]|nr:ribonuclease J [Deltaproteobacteria bacterium]
MSYVRIIPLGGVREFGLNSTVIETSRGSILIDAGLMFPKYTPTGIDQIIPDFTYIIQNQEAFQGILLTHGHEDHIGALPYLLRDAPIPVYGHPFTLELLRRKLREYEMDGKINLVPVEHGKQITLCGMDIEFTEVQHSTLGCFSLIFHTIQGTVVHSGDFRRAPKSYGTVDGSIRLFLCESTNAAVEPKCTDEAKILKNIDTIIKETPGAVLVATFSSHVKRIQAMYELALKNNRKLSIIGRSLNQVVDIATELNYLELNPADMINPEMISSVKRDKLLILCTGTQGEGYSALSLIARGWHKFKVKTDDSVIISARIIPGNEIAIARCIDQLIEFGAKVYYPDVADIHATGHATHDEIHAALKLLKPQIVMPIHGELRHMKALGEIVNSIPELESQVIYSRPGQIWTIQQDGMHLTDEAPHGKCFVDGQLTGDIQDVVLRDRRHISAGGLLVAFAVIDGNTSGVVIGPDVMCKGVVPASMEQEIIDAVKQKAQETLKKGLQKELDIPALQTLLREELGLTLKARLGKKPMIIPIIMEI